MISVDELLDCYERIAGVTGHMLAAARGGDWDSLIQLEAQYLGHVDTIRRFDPDVPMDPAARTRKHDIIRRILADDAAIRELALPRLAHLDALLRSNRQRRALRDAYGASN